MNVAKKIKSRKFDLKSSLHKVDPAYFKLVEQAQ